MGITIAYSTGHTARVIWIVLSYKKKIVWVQPYHLSPRSAAYTPRWTGSALIQVMACRLFGSKPLRESVLTYGPLEPNSVKL